MHDELDALLLARRLLVEGVVRKVVGSVLVELVRLLRIEMLLEQDAGAGLWRLLVAEPPPLAETTAGEASASSARTPLERDTAPRAGKGSIL